MQILLVVNNPADWSFNIPDVEIVSARSYLMDERYSVMRGVRVYNLCRSYRYQSTGYYVSLLAAARGHKPMPWTSAIQDMKSVSIIRITSDEISELIQKNLHHLQSDRFDLSIYFGRNVARQYDRLSRKLFNLFEAPLLRARFAKQQSGWQIQNIGPISGNDIPDDHRSFVEEAAREYFISKRWEKRKRKNPRFEMAILANPDEAYPPSDEKAIHKFRKAAESLGIWTELITKDDYGWIPQYDSMFIRETTAVNHHTYRFSRRAAAQGLVVIDDPDSILRCTNKVYLEELLKRNKIRTPKTMIVHKDNLSRIAHAIGFPVILKQPDSSFSQGVMKAENSEELTRYAEKLFSKSDLFIAQEYLFTEFDWRVGIIDRKPLYVCRYYMARNHWQIQGRDKNGEDTYGNVDTISVADAPPEIIKTALKAANLIGDGLYGVDLKFTHGKCYVIEINDNPSMDSGVEDVVLKDQLYTNVMNVFLNRMQRQREGVR